jgi:hypothetical protein
LREIAPPRQLNRSTSLLSTAMKDTLIIQFRASGAVSDLDWLVEIEEALIQGFSQNGKAVVDGHDFGSETMNIFLFPKQGWGSAVEIVKAYLKNHRALDRALIIKRSKTERYTVVWPEKYVGEFERL